METILVFLVLCDVITGINIILHSYGCHLLGRRRLLNHQELFILNLSVIELLKNTINFIMSFYHFVDPLITIPKLLVHVLSILGLVYSSGLLLLFFLFMIYITFDRLLRTALGIKYHIYVTKHRVRMLIRVSWLLAPMYSGSCTVVYVYREDANYDMESFLYPSAVCNCICLVVFIFTYSFIFVKLIESRRRLQKQTTTQRFGGHRKARFRVCFLLITTFLVFNTIPTLIYLYISANGETSEYFVVTVYIFYSISDTADACIYILLRQSLYGHLTRIFKTRRKKKDGNNIFHVIKMNPRNSETAF